MAQNNRLQLASAIAFTLLCMIGGVLVFEPAPAQASSTPTAKGIGKVVPTDPPMLVRVVDTETNIVCYVMNDSKSSPTCLQMEKSVRGAIK